MTKIQSFLVFDNSSNANYKNWAWGTSAPVYGVKQAFEQLGFLQTNDQGQVVWNNITATITSVQSSGTVATYGYSSLSPADVAVGSPAVSNPTLRPGMLVNAITGLTNAAFDVSAPGNSVFPAGTMITSVTQTSTTTGFFTVNTTVSTTGFTADSGSLSIPGITLPAAWSTNVGPANNVAYNGLANVGYTTNYRGYWQAGVQYNPGDVVTYSSSGTTNPHNYLNLVQNTGTAPTSAFTATWVFFNYEIWQTNDDTGSPPASPPVPASYYFKVEYSNTGTNTPAIFYTIGTATTGQSIGTSLGAFGGGSISTVAPNCLSDRESVFASTAGTAQGALTFECDFYGGGSGTSFSFLLWRNAGTNIPIYFGIERALSNTGTYTTTYMTFVKGVGPGTTSGNWICEPVLPSGSNPGIGTRTDFVPTISVPDTNNYQPGNVNSYQLGQNIAVLPCFPLLGYVGNPLTILLGMKANDAVEGGTFTVTLYGVTHTYLMTKAQQAVYFGAGVTNFNNAFAIRWE